MYVQHKIKAHTCDHCCSGKVRSVTCYKCVSVAFGIQNTVHIRHIVVCGISDYKICFHIIS
jgi:hypothetical protein